MHKRPFYITTTLPYVNADPHIGTVLEFVQADAIARYHRLKGEDVIFNTGTDEHGQKIYTKALQENKTPKDYCDEKVKSFKETKKLLNLSYTHFIRTTDDHHIHAAQEFWKRCYERGDIKKGKYKVKYCVGCELEKTDTELKNGKCPIHPNLEIELIEEENYFFAFSKYKEKLLKLYEDNPDFVVPPKRQKEITAFVKKGLRDFSVSRLKSKMPWGIDVPGDPKHVMYVWFDALVNYISTLGWPDKLDTFERYWPGIQIAGKDNLRQQSAMWQAMLLSAGLPPSKQIIIHGFITINGQKISKSLGNVIHPIDLVKKYGTDATRYYLLGKIPTLEDADFSIEKFERTYNADLANGLGNLISRTISMVHKYFGGKVPKGKNNLEAHQLGIDKDLYNWQRAQTDLDKALDEYEIDAAVSAIWRHISTVDKYIEMNKPWELNKTDKTKLCYVILGLLGSLHQIAWMLYPFLPETSVEIAKVLKLEDLLKDTPYKKDSRIKLKPGTRIEKIKPLFPRI